MLNAKCAYIGRISERILTLIVLLAGMGICSEVKAQPMRSAFRFRSQGGHIQAARTVRPHVTSARSAQLRAPGQLGEKFYLDLPSGRFVVEARSKRTRQVGASQSVVGKVLSQRDFKRGVRSGLGSGSTKPGKHDNKKFGYASFSQTVLPDGSVGSSAYIQLPSGQEFMLENDLLQEIDPSQLPGCADHAQDHAHEQADTSNTSGSVQMAAASADAATVRVLVYYSPQASSAMGGVAAITARINDMVAYTNTSYEYSAINTFKVELAGVLPLPGSEHSDFAQNLYNVTNYDGVWDSVHQDRANYAADLVSVIVNNYQYCGIAWLMPALSTSSVTTGFSVVNWSCVSSFAHELGHNMGATHDKANAGWALFNYSYGWRFNGKSGVEYRTVMAYAPGSRLPYFSNPNITYDGVATGVVDQADNARTLNQTGPVIAQYFGGSGGGVAPTVAPTATKTSTPAGTATYTPTPTMTPTATRTPTPGYYQVSGSIKDSSDRSLSGVRVTMAIGNDTHVQFTDSAGYYQFTGILGERNYNVTPSLAGYSFQAQSGLLQSIKQHDFTGAQMLYTLSGLVVDPNKMPVVGVTIDGGALGQTISDASGRFSFGIGRGVPYTLSASKSGLAFRDPILGGVAYGNQERVFVGYEE